MECFFWLHVYVPERQFMETPWIGGVYAVTANEVLSGKELSFLMKSAGRFHDGCAAEDLHIPNTGGG